MGNFEEVYTVLRETGQYLPKELFDKVFEEMDKLEQRVLDESIAIADMAVEDTLNYANGVSEDDVIAMLKEQGELNGGS